jgi:phosphate transport system substrate-binding protein
MKLKLFRKLLLFLGGTLLCEGILFADITGAGSSFIYPLMTNLSEMYYVKSKDKVNYQAVGSMAGLEMLSEGLIDFSATEIIWPQKIYTPDKLEIIPVAVNGIVPVVNIPGIADNELIIDGNILADMYLGKISYWDDEAIKKLNPTLNLPHSKIILASRIGMSGTTYIFSEYLSSVSEEWKKEVGVSSVIKSSVSMVTGVGNAGVAAYLKQIKNSIGYLEYSYLVNEKILSKVRMFNKYGAIVPANYSSFSAALTNYDWNSKLPPVNTAEAGAWPITGITYFVLKKDAENKKLYSYIDYIINNDESKEKALEMGYVLPLKVYNISFDK